MKQLIPSNYTSMGWSKIGSMMMCPRKYALSYLAPKEDKQESSSPNPAMIKGILIHQGLAHYYASLIENADTKALYTFEEAMYKKCEQNPLWMPYLDACTQTVQEYIFHYTSTGEHDKMNVLHVEKLVKTSIDGHTITGRVDMIVEDLRERKVWFVDHKTTNKLEDQLEYYSISGQMLGYQYMGGKMYGDRFGGMIVNIIKVSDGDGDAKMHRAKVLSAPNMLQSFPQTVKHSISLMKRFESQPIENYPMTMHELVCFHRYGACRHLNKCKGIK